MRIARSRFLLFLQKQSAGNPSGNGTTLGLPSPGPGASPLLAVPRASATILDVRAMPQNHSSAKRPQDANVDVSNETSGVKRVKLATESTSIVPLPLWLAWAPTKPTVPDRLPRAPRKPIAPHVSRYKVPTLSELEAQDAIRTKLDEYDNVGDPIAGRIWTADTQLNFYPGFFKWDWLELENKHGWKWLPARFSLKLWSPQEAPPEEHFEQFAITPEESISDANLPWHVSVAGEDTAQILNLRLRECGYRVSFALER